MTKVLIDFINDVIDETSEEFKLIFGKTKQDVDNVKEGYKYFFAGFTIFIGLIIGLISSLIIDFIIGIIILFIALVSVLLVFFKRQRRIRKLHDTYGEYISIIGQKKDAFLKIRKQIHYWDYILDDIFSSKNIRNTLLALETIDHSYILYKIGIYEKLFPLLEIDTKSTLFWALLNFVKGSAQITRELINFKSKPLPFFIHDEINRIYFENKKYIPKYFMQSLTGPNYEVYINSNDYIDVHYGGTLKFIKKYGFKVFAIYNQKIKPYEFLLDENLNIVNMRLKSKSKS